MNGAAPGGRGLSGGTFVVSLDFELHWGVRDRWSVGDHRARLLGAREAVPAMLELFEAFGIHATWAIVGFLFFEGKRELLDALPSRRPAYVDPVLSPYAGLAAIGASERDDPFHFAPSLIRQIAHTPDQEIGTHTLSHYYCLEPGQGPADFREDVHAAMEITLDALQVFGGYGYLEEYPMARRVRDAKACQIYEGTNQVQRVVIAREVVRS